VRVYLIDDHLAVREAVAAMLDAAPDIEVVGHAGDVRSGLAEIAVLQPDLVVLDLKLPGVGGLAAIKDLRTRHPQIGIVVFTMYDNPSYVLEATQLGAGGYVLKSASKSDLLRAVRAVFNDDAYLQAEVTKPLLRRLVNQMQGEGARADLTPREMQVLEFLAEGLSNKAIANFLSISEPTVKGHLKHLYAKLGASDRAHAVAIALRQRIIE
jgi:DNA-binding NarL/FixJ family response regulator